MAAMNEILESRDGKSSARTMFEQRNAAGKRAWDQLSPAEQQEIRRLRDESIGEGNTPETQQRSVSYAERLRQLWHVII